MSQVRRLESDGATIGIADEARIRLPGQIVAGALIPSAHLSSCADIDGDGARDAVYVSGGVNRAPLEDRLVLCISSMTLALLGWLWGGPQLDGMEVVTDAGRGSCVLVVSAAREDDPPAMRLTPYWLR